MPSFDDSYTPFPDALAWASKKRQGCSPTKLREMHVAQKVNARSLALYCYSKSTFIQSRFREFGNVFQAIQAAGLSEDAKLERQFF
jgi:hypothetical protein